MTSFFWDQADTKQALDIIDMAFQYLFSPKIDKEWGYGRHVKWRHVFDGKISAEKRH